MVKKHSFGVLPNQKMPPCTYGKACTRKGCAYSHPTNHVINEDVVCMPFLSESCLYGNRCRNRHVLNDEKLELLERFSRKPCRFGAHCRSDICLYAHPDREGNELVKEILNQEKISIPDVSEKDLAARLAAQERQTAAYDEYLHGKQVSARTESASFASESAAGHSDGMWSCSSNGHAGGKLNGKPIEHNGFRENGFRASGFELAPTALDSQFIDNESSCYDQTLDCSDSESLEIGGLNLDFIDGQDDDGLFQDPTPQQAHGGISVETGSKQSKLKMVGPTMAERIKLTAKKTQDKPEIGKTRQRAAGVVKIPQELWIASSRRNPGVFQIQDPISRFYACNQVYSMPGIIDLHFQTSQTAPIVLDEMLPKCGYYGSWGETGGKVWIITGSGHHTQQRLYRLFDVVETYLRERDFDFQYGTDTNGHRSAFCVLIKRKPH